MPCGPCICESLVTRPLSPPTCGTSTAKYAAAITADILMKNCTMSITSTPHSPDCVAKTTLSSPTNSSVCQRSKPNRIAAILHAARFTVAMMTQLNNRPRYTERKPRTAPAALPE